MIPNITLGEWISGKGFLHEHEEEEQNQDIS